MRRTFRVATLGALLLTWASAPAAAQIVQEKIDYDVIERIRDEGFNRSQIEELGGYLTDVIGPRLTGSPAMLEANEWTASKLREWGFENVKVEPWGEVGRGWDRVSYQGRFLEPFVQPLHAQPEIGRASCRDRWKKSGGVGAGERDGSDMGCDR